MQFHRLGKENGHQRSPVYINAIGFGDTHKNSNWTPVFFFKLVYKMMCYLGFPFELPVFDLWYYYSEIPISQPFLSNILKLLNAYRVVYNLPNVERKPLSLFKMYPPTTASYIYIFSHKSFSMNPAWIWGCAGQSSVRIYEVNKLQK